MGRIVTGAVGGVVAGVLVAEVMRAARRRGMIEQTGIEQQEAWLDRTFALRRRLGKHGSKRVGRTNFLAATAVAGAAYGILQPRRHPAHPLLAGGVYGTILYVLHYMWLAPKLGVVPAGATEAPKVVAQRLGIHALFGMAVAVIAGGLTPEPVLPWPVLPRQARAELRRLRD